ncbi:MAG: hypothetical protein GY714_22085 [Desulfobacterales bacterium]|nr:hypothetical protein [Desulfobacterales bacterium]MCP4160404.1 hypothetical protein [Deltaproteobacteria bacterium]
MKSAPLILIFLSIIMSTVYAEEFAIHTSDAKSLLIANHVYPSFEKKEGTMKDGWFLSAKSEKKFELSGENYTVYSWNEINNPSVATQMDHYNYGGLLILKNGAYLLKFRAPNQKIQRVITVGNTANIVALYSFAQRGNAEEYLNVYHLKGNRLSNVFSRQILESDYMGSGSYHMKSDVIYKDLNGDGVSDILIKEKQYEIEDTEKTERYTLKETVKFIIKKSY